MISKSDVEKLPTKLRNDIVEYLVSNMKYAEKTKVEAATSYVVSTDEVHRSSALIAQGELNAFTLLYNIFK